MDNEGNIHVCIFWEGNIQSFSSVFQQFLRAEGKTFHKKFLKNIVIWRKSQKLCAAVCITDIYYIY